MRNLYLLVLLVALSLTGLSQGSPNDRGLLQAFKDDAEWHTDFATQNLEGWIINDLDGFNTSGPYFAFPGKGGPLGFLIYNPSQTDPANTMEAYLPRSGNKYFGSISSYTGASNDWMISKELAPHQGGKFSFWAKQPFDFFGDEQFNVGYSMTGTAPEDFIYFNANPIVPMLTWQLYQYDIPAGAKHLAINCVSYAYFLMVDDVQFAYNLQAEAPGSVTNFTSAMELGTQIKAHLNWTNPVISISGGALSSVTGVKIYRGTHPMNFNEIADVPATAGEAMSYSDNLPESGFYTYRIEPYNEQGRGLNFDSPVTYYGYETIPAAPANITFSRNESNNTVISWTPVASGSMGGELVSPVAGYSIVRKLGTDEVTLATMHTATTFTESDIPSLNIYTYTITALLSETQPGIPAVATGYSGLAPDQYSVTAGTAESEQPFELTRESILTQSIYTAEQIGSTGLITDLTWFANLEDNYSAVYKIYMSTTNRSDFGLNNEVAIWEFYGNQKLVFNGTLNFTQGLSTVTAVLDQPFYYDAASGENVIITIIKPQTTEVSDMWSPYFMNTRVDDNRTYFAIGYATDMSQITTQPSSWMTDPVTTIPSVVTSKNINYANISGTVTMEDGTTLLPEVSITVMPADEMSFQMESVLSAEDGSYTIPALLPGNYIITFSKETYNDYTESITVSADQSLVLNASLIQAIPIVISGNVTNTQSVALKDVTLILNGFSQDTLVTDETGSFIINAFANKAYSLTAIHPLYNTLTTDFTSLATDFTLETITLELNALKPMNVVAENIADTGYVSWEIPEGTFNETLAAWGSKTNTGNGWGDGGDEFTAAIRFETSDLAAIVPENGKLTHVKAYISNTADIIIEVFQGENASELLYSQPVSISEEGWYTFELNKTIVIDVTKELWIGLHYLPDYAAYPIGLDEGPNAPLKKGSMLYSGGAWNQMSLTNKNWNIYGIIHSTVEAEPTAFRVLRKQTTESEWNLLSVEHFTSRNFTDASLSEAEPGIYHYAVSAQYDTVNSANTVSNEITIQMVFDLDLQLVADYGSSEFAYVALSNGENFYEKTVETGQSNVIFNDIWRGDYNLYIYLPNYEVVEMQNFSVSGDQTIEIPMTLNKVKPSNLTASLENENIKLNWTLHQTFTDKIETYTDFERYNISNYILRDLDGFETYTYTNFTWPDAGIPMSYMVFNPYATTPAVELPTYSGRRVLSAFAGPDGVNNDWLIIPVGSGQLSFMATSLTTSGLEKFRVLYSTSGNQTADFSQLGNIVTCPVDWTEYTYDLPANTKYVAINYVSYDTYFLLIDDITFEKEYNHALSYNVYLDGEPVATGLTETSYTFEELESNDHLVEVEAVYSTGNSEKAEISIVGIGTDDLTTNQFSIYPNPSKGIFHMNLEKSGTVNITDLSGKTVYSNYHKTGYSKLDLNLPDGTYIIRVLTTDGVNTAKLVIL